MKTSAPISIFKQALKARMSAARWGSTLTMMAVLGGALQPMAQEAESTRLDAAAEAVNNLGLDLLRSGDGPGGNSLVSPYSIQVALAMTYAGAAGETREEMRRVLGYGGLEDGAIHGGFAALAKELEAMAERSREVSQRRRGPRGKASDPLTFVVANRLYGQKGHAFRPEFVGLLKTTYGAPMEPADFINNAGQARRRINAWVEDQTRDRIRDLVPPDGVTRDTRLVLVNAIYMKAPWASPFQEGNTREETFHLPGGESVQAPFMTQTGRMGYVAADGYTAVTLPYAGGEIHFLALVPADADGLKALEARVDAGMLRECASLPAVEVNLHLPKFKVEPPLMRLGEKLRGLGMKTAFDVPRGSANFDAMAPRKPDDYLRISEVFHKTFLDLDEEGTEAAAATAVSMVRVTSIAVPKPMPVEVRVDRPFLYAIQHRASGACLFLGRMERLP
jgi:serpin B